MTMKLLTRVHQATLVLTIALCAAAWPMLASAQQGMKLENPLQFQSIADFIAGAMRALVMVALPIITLFIVYAGFQFITARGKPEGLNKAKANFMYVLIGALLVLGAWVLATLIGGTVSQLLA